MESAAPLLFVVLLVCALGMAVFGVLWFTGREA